MNKEERAKLLRERFAAKYASRAWTSRGKKRKLKPVHYNATRLSEYNDQIRFAGRFGGNRFGKTPDWVFMPDTKQRMAIIATDHYDRAGSIMTFLAKKMYEYNRMQWDHA